MGHVVAKDGELCRGEQTAAVGEDEDVIGHQVDVTFGALDFGPSLIAAFGATGSIG